MNGTKRLAALLLTLGLALSLAGCGPAQQPQPSASPSVSPSPSPSPTQDAALTVALGSEPGTLDPAVNQTAQGTVIVQHLFEGLMTWADDGQETSDGVNGAKLVPGQAEGYDRAENADGTVTYTFHLREGIQWSDGKEVTAQDFVYGWQRTVGLGSDAPYAYALECVVNAPEIFSGELEATELAVEAVDERTFAVTVHDVPWFLSLCALPATAPIRADVEEAAPAQWTFTPETCVSNGKYQLSQWDYGSQIVLTPNEHYYAPVEGPQRITFLAADDQSAITAALDGGTVDFAQLAAGEALTSRLEEGKAHAAPYAGVYFLTFQTQAAPFDDPLVRRAFTLAVDRNKLVSEVTQGGQTPAGALVPAGITDDGGGDFRARGGSFFDVSEKAYEANCQEARELLAQAGYPEGAGFPAVTYLCNRSESHEAIAHALAEMWREALGVAVTVDIREWPAFLQARKNGEFSIARDGWVADWDDPLTFLDRWISDGENNNAGYRSQAFDDRLAAAEGAKASEQRMGQLHQAEQQLVGEDWALCPLYFYTRPYAMGGKVKGLYIDPMGSFHFDAAKR